MTAKQNTAQRDAALHLANTVRLANKERRCWMRSLPEARARAELVELLERPDDIIGADRIGRLLLSVPRFGQAKTIATLRYAGIVSADRRIRDLTLRQRARVVDVLNDPRVISPSTSLPPLTEAA